MDAALIPAAIGTLTALALVMRATPAVFVSIAKAIDVHSGVYAGLRSDLDQCKLQHTEQGARIDHLEAQSRANDGVLEKAFAALEERDITITGLRTALASSHALTESLRADIRSGLHASTTHRGKLT